MSRKLLIVALALVAIASAGGAATYAAFTATTQNTGNSATTGTVALGDNDTGAMFNLSSLKGNDSSTKCIKVTSSGSLASGVRLYGTTGGTGLDPYVSVTVTRGAYSPSEPAFGSCTNFVADSTGYVTGQPNGVIYAGTLQAFPDTYAAGVSDPTSGSPEVWTNGESHVYRFELSVADNNTAAGKTATQTFTWEARNN